MRSDQIGKYSEVHESVRIGNGSKIGMYCVIGKDVFIGNNVTIGNYCQIEDGTLIHDNSVLQGSVKTGKHCEIGKNVTLKWGVILTSYVVIQEGVFMGARAVTLGSTAKRKTEHGTVIQARAYIGAGVYIAAKTKIAADIIVGAMSFVNENLMDPGTYVGVPAKKLDDFERKCRAFNAKGIDVRIEGNGKSLSGNRTLYSYYVDYGTEHYSAELFQTPQECQNEAIEIAQELLDKQK